MAKLGIIAIVFGAMLFALGLIPGLLGPMIEGLSFGITPPRRGSLIHTIQADMRRYGDLRLVVGGGVMMIVGLVALPPN